MYNTALQIEGLTFNHSMVTKGEHSCVHRLDVIKKRLITVGT